MMRDALENLLLILIVVPFLTNVSSAVEIVIMTQIALEILFAELIIVEQTLKLMELNGAGMMTAV